ncbi:uncharacterized protein LOC135100503 isoform X2 [Scylla paramamosain]|uniref:uncharacterized protein LOC135100503 isoform X2 n=1 Tax=Scylla paramamosain TaxID=85552 RepID=UPI003082C9E3
MDLRTSLRGVLVLLGVWVCVAAAQEFNEQDRKQFPPIRMNCQSIGRFRHPYDCGKFVDCLPDPETGKLYSREGSCNGQAFHPTFKKCGSIDKVKGCKPRSGRAIAANHKLDYVCEGASSEFVCADCKTLVNCINGTAYPEPCASGDLCAVKDAQFGGGVCYPSEPIECMCEHPNEFKVDYYDETRFFFCENQGSDPVIYQCPDDHLFVPSLSQCRSYAGLPECTSIGVFANELNCSQYYTCIFTTNGWVQKPSSCDNETHSGLMYNEQTGKCEDPCTWDTGKFSCSVEGRFPDPVNCNAYYECVEDDSYESGLRQTHHSCPDGYEWDPTAREAFGHCVVQGTRKAKCSPVKENKCFIPQDQCNATGDQ